MMVSLCQVHTGSSLCCGSYPPLGVGASNLSMGRTHTLGSYQVHNSADGAKPPLESNKSNFAAGIPPLGGLTRQSVVGLTLARSKHIQSVVGSHPYFRTLFKFAGKRDTYNCTKHMVYTWGFYYLDYPLDVLVSCK